MTEEGLRQVFKKMLGTTPGDRISRKHAIENLDKKIAEIKKMRGDYSLSWGEMLVSKKQVLKTLDSETKTHKCSFGFEKKHIGKKGQQEPKKGERGFSRKKDDWVCRCGKTRREYLNEKEALNSKKEDK